MKQDNSTKSKIHTNGESQKMNKKNHTSIQIPTSLAKKIKNRMEETEFPSFSSYVTYILGEMLKLSFLHLRTSQEDLNMSSYPIRVQDIPWHSSCGLSKCYKQLDYIW